MNLRVNFGTRHIDFSLSYSERKSLGIKVHPDGSVAVLSPHHIKETEIKARIKDKAPWILKQMDQFNTFRPATPARRFVNGETHLCLGRQYRLKIEPNATNFIRAYRGQMWIYASDTQKKALELQLEQWYRKKAALVFEELLKGALPKFRKYKIATPSLTIRKMSKRWGSCTPGGKIILNLELIKAPKGSIEYVIIHELCHLVYHSHTRSFFDLQNHMLPDWKKWKDRLENVLA